MRPSPTSFLGRERELDALGALVATEARVVTLFGPAGTGKTRLATRFGEVCTGFEGVWLCDLVPARCLDDVLVAVAHALQVPCGTGTNAEALAERLADAIAARGRVLVILDNCEQVVSEVARLTMQWVDAAGQATFLTTSRERLRIAEEHVFEVPPLGLPTNARDTARSEAVRLFAERALLVRPDWRATATELETVAEIVRRLDGLPLAIELAAARVNVLGVGAILERLAHRFELLTSTTHGIDARQRTLRGALEWSWDLLSVWERTALVQCAVLRGPFTIEAAEHVVDLSAQRDAPRAVDAVQALREKSLLFTLEAPGLEGETCLCMLESIREFAREQLERSGERESATNRHFRYFADVFAPRALGRDGAIGAQDALIRSRADLIAAHASALRAGDAPRAIAIVLPMESLALDHGPFAAYAAMVSRTLEAAERVGLSDGRIARLLVGRGCANTLSGNRAGAVADTEAALKLARATGDLVSEIRANGLLGQMEWEAAEVDAARGRLRALASLAEAATDAETEGLARMFMGILLTAIGGDLEGASEQFARAGALLSASGDDRRLTSVLSLLGWVLLELGRFDEAESMLTRAVALARATHSGVRYGHGVFYLAAHRIEAARPGEAIELCEEAARALARVGIRNAGAAESLRGIALAMLDDLTRAQRAFDLAESELAWMHGGFLAAAKIHRGHLDLALARAAAAAGDYERASKCRRDAEQRLADPNRSNDDVRFATRILRRALAADTTPARPPPRPEAFVVAHDGSWFRPPHGRPVDIARRVSVRNILRALVDRRLATPGDETPAHALVESGWPGEEMSFEAGIGRVRVVISDLRRLGLDRVLRHFGEGYALDPDVPVEIVSS